MKIEILDKIIELNKDSNWINTSQFVNELKLFGDANNIINNLIDKGIIYRNVEESIDVCSFNTDKLTRLLKLKNLSDKFNI